MGVEYDEKGKFFTEFISKNAIYSHIQTPSHHIQGYVHVRKDERLSDEINKENNFLPITKAEIYSADGNIIFTCEFLAINRNHIVWIMPIEERITQGE